MPGTIKTKKSVALIQLQAFAAGLQKHFPGGSFMLGNTPYTIAALVQSIQTLCGDILALDAAQAQVSQAVTDLRATNAGIAPIVQAAERMVRTMFGSAAGPLGDFGLQPPKVRTPLTSQQLLVAAKKARATRQARGTKGRKQRLAIKGNVTSVSITPVTTIPVPPSVE